MNSNKIIRLAVSGCCGRMGRRIAALALEDKNFFLSGAMEHSRHPDLGKDYGQYLGVGKSGISIKSEAQSIMEGSDVLIEFTDPKATISHLEACLALKKPMVIGTTALSEKDEKKIRAAAKKIAIVKSSNMSLGINLLFAVLAEFAETFGKYYDIEITEAHHNRKKDAPSGTALSMAKIICNSLGFDVKKALRFGRSTKSGPRTKKEIGVHAIRAGEIVGDHTVLFAGKGESIELSHSAQSRDAFAKGALLAARFLYGKKNGFYDMQDVLEIKK